MNKRALISAARGCELVDLLIKNVNLINVLSGEIYPTSIAIKSGWIVALEEVPAQETFDGEGLYAAPGFIDGHVHIESSLLAPPQFAQAILPKGTTAVIADPHEIANVLGEMGLEYMFNASADLPVEIYFMIPSCVPATHLETAGAVIDEKLVRKYIGHERVLGLAEVMNYPGVIFGDRSVLAKIIAAEAKNIDGHAPLLSGKDLSAYRTAGITTDHENSSIKEAREKLRKGFFIMLREGSAAHNLLDLLPLVNQYNVANFGFVTDDRHPDMLKDVGHINAMISQAISKGIEPIWAFQMAALNTARHYGLKHLGALAPGYQADIVLFEDLQRVIPKFVFKRGRLVVQDEKLIIELKYSPIKLPNTVNFSDFSVNDLKIKREGRRIRVIEIVPNQILTRCLITEVPDRGDYLLSDPEQDLLKLVVVERHKATGRIGLGMVKGLGIKRGALASSVAHDSHNIISAGTNDEDIVKAVYELKKMGGGQIIVVDGKVLGQLPLPIGGLMSEEPLEEVYWAIEKLKQTTKALGCKLDDPFMTLSFLALPVIPELKLTDFGLIDVNSFQPVPLWVD